MCGTRVCNYSNLFFRAKIEVFHKNNKPPNIGLKCNVRILKFLNIFITENSIKIQNYSIREIGAHAIEKHLTSMGA